MKEQRSTSFSFCKERSSAFLQLLKIYALCSIDLLGSHPLCWQARRSFTELIRAQKRQEEPAGSRFLSGVLFRWQAQWAHTFLTTPHGSGCLILIWKQLWIFEKSLSTHCYWSSHSQSGYSIMTPHRWECYWQIVVKGHFAMCLQRASSIIHLTFQKIIQTGKKFPLDETQS